MRLAVALVTGGGSGIGQALVVDGGPMAGNLLFGQDLAKALEGKHQ
jgi:NAD(P)-dependent dehydrogenase (short-subunit alcohol dehydrogenase family)